MSIIDFSDRSTEFIIGEDDFSHLEIRATRNNPDFHYFYDTHKGSLTKDFVLKDGRYVALLCRVTMIRKDDRYSPRLEFKKIDRSKPGNEVVELPLPNLPETRNVKAQVDTSDGRENLWKLIDYLQSVTSLDIPRSSFRMVDRTRARLADFLARQERGDLLRAVHTALGGSLSDADIALLANRKTEVRRFERLLKEEAYFDAECQRLQKTPEGLWQHLFENNSWIFGYGLNLVTHESFGKLEQITTGANVFGGGGKRIDALMKTRAVISSLLFCEIKRHDTLLLENRPYRAPDVYQPSKELVGGTAQLQKTVRKAIRNMDSQVKKLALNDGTPTDIDFSTTRPRQVLLIGSLTQFRTDAGVNGEMIESFELYRKSLMDVDVITFDELYERARFIVNA